MKKLKLQIDELCIEQFQLQPVSAATQGTVRGLEDACSYPYICPEWPISYSCDNPRTCC